jgi:hypothetical protein
VFKRKPKQLSVEEIYKNSDFARRFGRDLLDHKYAQTFSLDASLRYEDDPRQEKYEIATIDGKEHLVFVFSVVKVALAMDEAVAVNGKILLNIELRRDSLDSFSRVGSFPLSLAANLGMLMVFFGVLYAAFPIVRTALFGVKPKIQS